MAPPARGTKAYQTYLQKQRLRRARERLQLKQKKIAKQAKPLVRAGVKRAAEQLQEQVCIEVQKKNKFMRKNNNLMHANTQLLATNVALEKKLQAALAKLSTTEKALKTGEKAREEAERGTRAAQRALQQWELWWSRVESTMF